MITVREFLKTLTGPDRIKIVKDKEILFVGYRADGKEIPLECLDAEMKLFRSEPEIRHREWKKARPYATIGAGPDAGFQVFRSGNEAVLQNLYLGR